MKILSLFKIRKPSGYWSYRRVKNVAEQYATRTAFAKSQPSAYCAAKDKGILDLVQANLPRQNTAWNFEKVQKEALKYNTRAEFDFYSRGACAFARRTGILNLVCRHMKSNPKWTFELCLIEAKKYTKYSDWYQAKGSGAKQACRKLWAKEIKKLVWGQT